MSPRPFQRRLGQTAIAIVEAAVSGAVTLDAGTSGVTTDATLAVAAVLAGAFRRITTRTPKR